MTCQTVRNEYVGLYCGEEQKKKLEKNSLSNNRIRCRVSDTSRDISDRMSDEIRAYVIRQESAVS